jgi:hypothetical protein
MGLLEHIYVPILTPLCPQCTFAFASVYKVCCIVQTLGSPKDAWSQLSTKVLHISNCHPPAMEQTSISLFTMSNGVWEFGRRWLYRKWLTTAALALTFAWEHLHSEGKNTDCNSASHPVVQSEALASSGAFSSVLCLQWQKRAQKRTVRWGLSETHGPACSRGLHAAHVLKILNSAPTIMQLLLQASCRLRCLGPFWGDAGCR